MTMKPLAAALPFWNSCEPEKKLETLREWCEKMDLKITEQEQELKSLRQKLADR